MVQCPICSKSIAVTENNYGTLYRCEHCQAEFFIGFDGVPENSKEPHPTDLSSNVMTPLPERNEAPRDIFSIDNGEQQQNQDQPDAYAMNGDEPAGENHYSEPNQDNEIRPQPTSDAFKNFAQDVQDFGNDSVTSGLLTFDIEISGIDLGEMKRDLLDALDDKRFGWNLSDITQQIRDGTLILKNVSAPKIIVLVKRITPIGLNLSWRHHVSTQ